VKTLISGELQIKGKMNLLHMGQEKLSFIITMDIGELKNFEEGLKSKKNQDEIFELSFKVGNNGKGETKTNKKGGEIIFNQTLQTKTSIYKEKNGKFVSKKIKFELNSVKNKK
jgi:hypothetical protein